MPSYKLYYFDGRGRAELCRLLFTLAGQEFEDVRLAGETWQAFKPKTPTGQIPVLEVDGRLFSQSVAIATFLARQFGLYGETNLEGLQIDEILGIISDLLNEGVKAMLTEESKREAANKELKEVQVPRFLTALSKRLKESGTGYFVGSTVTLADLAVYDLSFSTNQRFPDVLDNFPDLQAHMQKIGNVDKIKQYVDKRKPTPF